MDENITFLKIYAQHPKNLPWQLEANRDGIILYIILLLNPRAKDNNALDCYRAVHRPDQVLLLFSLVLLSQIFDTDVPWKVISS